MRQNHKIENLHKNGINVIVQYMFNLDICFAGLYKKILILPLSTNQQFRPPTLCDLEVATFNIHLYP